MALRDNAGAGDPGWRRRVPGEVEAQGSPEARGWGRLAGMPGSLPAPGRGDSCGEPAAGDPALCLQPRVGDVGVPVAFATRPGGCTTWEEPARKALGKAHSQHPELFVKRTASWSPGSVA